MMKKFVLSLFCVAFLSHLSLAQDDNRLTVIELFTSQGCSSCPPADAALKAMRDKPGILTLSWPVDYWDRLGWEDTFAEPYNAKRQAAYNKRLGRGGVFTPQMVFDGRFECVGSKKDEVRANVDQARTFDRPHISPGLVLGGDKVALTLPETNLDTVVSVRVVWYLADATVEVGEGENRGRKLHYTNVVRGFDMLEDWNGDARSVEIDPARGRKLGASHMAVLLQEDYSHGPLVGAMSLKITP